MMSLPGPPTAGRPRNWPLPGNRMSSPGPPSSPSLPVPPLSRSLPSPPSTTRSIPAFASTTSSPGPPSSNRSSPKRESATKSLPSPPRAMSSPSKPSSRSLPGPPPSTSLPVTPSRRSLPGPPSRRSLPDAPSSSSSPSSPNSRSLAEPPESRSLPAAPKSWSREPWPRSTSFAGVPCSVSARRVPSRVTANALAGSATRTTASTASGTLRFPARSMRGRIPRTIATRYPRCDERPVAGGERTRPATVSRCGDGRGAARRLAGRPGGAHAPPPPLRCVGRRPLGRGTTDPPVGDGHARASRALADPRHGAEPDVPRPARRVSLRRPGRGRAVVDVRAVRPHLDAQPRLPSPRRPRGVPHMVRARHGARPVRPLGAGRSRRGQHDRERGARRAGRPGRRPAAAVAVDGRGRVRAVDRRRVARARGRARGGPAVSAGWESRAEQWLAWARTPEFDAYWSYRDAFFDLVPAPSGRTLEVGCGEGRVTRDLAARGHRVTALDASPTLLRAAAERDPNGEYVLGTAEALPFADATFALVVAYNVLIDVDDMPAAVHEAASVLAPGGALSICVPHPMADAGTWTHDGDDAPFVIEGDYLRARPFSVSIERDGLEMTFDGMTFPLEGYARALEAAGLAIDAIREPAAACTPGHRAERDGWTRWRRIPMFLMLRARKREN